MPRVWAGSGRSRGAPGLGAARATVVKPTGSHGFPSGLPLARRRSVVRTVGLGLVLAACGARVDAGGDDVFQHENPDAEPSAPDGPIAVADNECGVAQTQGELGTLAASGNARLQDPEAPDFLVYSL